MVEKFGIKMYIFLLQFLSARRILLDSRGYLKPEDLFFFENRQFKSRRKFDPAEINRRRKFGRK
jgi:hypothetical protein